MHYKPLVQFVSGYLLPMEVISKHDTITKGIEEFVTYYEETWLVGSYPLLFWNVRDCTTCHVY